MKIITYNINGIRAAIKKGLFEWLKSEDPDVICFQEIKANLDQIPVAEIEDMGYHLQVHSAEKKGYSGVATLSKKKPSLVASDTGMKAYDAEGRILRTDFGKTTILNCYFPSGSSGDERHGFKMQFLNDFRPWVSELLKTRDQIIVVGDYNIVHLDKDIHNPTRRDKPSGFKPEERAWMDEWFGSDFKDAFRTLYPDKEDDFSWWSYRMGSRKRNKGWRIDYISVTNKLQKKVLKSGHLHDAVHSDHAPVFAEIKI